LTEIFDAFQLIKTFNNEFDQLTKSVRSFWAVDRNFKITQNDINKSFDQLTKKNGRILAVDRNFLN
jgi:hypothetical protein